MTARKQHGNQIDAAQLAARLQGDEEYQRKKGLLDNDRQSREIEIKDAEQPIIADLLNAGVAVDSVWDLVNTSEPYPIALPVLMKHFERGGYPDRVVESLGRALAVKPAVEFWERLLASYLTPRSHAEEDSAAIALAACATEAQIDDVLKSLSLSERGESRLYFLRAVLNIAGEQGHEIVGSFTSDPVLGAEASALLINRQA